MQNVQNLKIFWKRAGDCMQLLHVINCWNRPWLLSKNLAVGWGVYQLFPPFLKFPPELNFACLELSWLFIQWYRKTSCIFSEDMLIHRMRFLGSLHLFKSYTFQIFLIVSVKVQWCCTFDKWLTCSIKTLKLNFIAQAKFCKIFKVCLTFLGNCTLKC